jgi:hypothetical protein
MLVWRPNKDISIAQRAGLEKAGVLAGIPDANCDQSEIAAVAGDWQTWPDETDPFGLHATVLRSCLTS